MVSKKFISLCISATMIIATLPQVIASSDVVTSELSYYNSSMQSSDANNAAYTAGSASISGTSSEYAGSKYIVAAYSDTSCSQMVGIQSASFVSNGTDYTATLAAFDTSSGKVIKEFFLNGTTLKPISNSKLHTINATDEIWTVNVSWVGGGTSYPTTATASLYNTNVHTQALSNPTTWSSYDKTLVVNQQTTAYTYSTINNTSSWIFTGNCFAASEDYWYISTAIDQTNKIATVTVYLSGAYPTETATPTAEPTPTPIAEGDGIIHLNGTSVDATGVENVTVSGTTVTITAAGEYNLSGTLNDGQIIVASADKSDEITLNLDNVNVTSSVADSATLLGTKGKVTIAATGTNTFTANGSSSAAIQIKNDLTMKSSGTINAISASGKGIHCKADLEIGTGDINVTAYDDGIRGNDSVKFTKKATNVTVTSTTGDGIRSNLDPAVEDEVYVSGGTVTINGGTLDVTATAGDGVQADTLLTVAGGKLTVNTGGEAVKANASSIEFHEDSTVEETPAEGDGCIVISGGILDLTAGGHGIKAVKNITVSGGDITVNAAQEGVKSKEIIYDTDGTTVLYQIVGDITITGGTLDITAGEDGISSASGSVIINDGSVTVNSQQDGIQAENVLYITGGTFDVKTYGGAPSGTASTSVTESCKGLKGINLIEVTGGTFTISSYDDALHSNNTVRLSGGEFNISTGDDGVHGDSYLYISDSANINITHCYEGLEAAKVYVNGGSARIVASDDGINGAGTEPTSEAYVNPYASVSSLSAGGFNPGGGPSGPTSSSYGYCEFNGGYVYINNTNGDGIDANGNLVFNDGIIIIDGASMDSEDGLDYDSSVSINGGFVFSMTSGGMDGLSGSFAQKCAAYGFSSGGGGGIGRGWGGTSTLSAGNYAVCDSSNNILFTFTRTKSSIQRVLISAPSLSSVTACYIKPITGVSSSNATDSYFGTFDLSTKAFTPLSSCTIGTGTSYTMTLQ